MFWAKYHCCGFVDINLELLGGGGLYCYSAWSVITYLITCHVIVVHTQQETCNMMPIQPGCKCVRAIRSSNGYKLPKTLISSKAKKLKHLSLLLE